MVMEVLRDNWGRQKAAEILGDLARNPGAGGAGAMGAGMGMGMAAGSVFGSMANQMFAPMNTIYQPTQSCLQDTQPTASGRFAPKNSLQSSQPSVQAEREDPFQVLSELKRLLDAGLISQEKYDAKVDEVMSRM